MKEELRHELVRLTYSPEIVSFELTREQGLEILKEIERLNNIINGMEKFFKYEFEEEVRPLNSFKVSVWTICLDKLQELKGVDKE